MQKPIKYQILAELLHSLEVEGYQFGISKHLQIQQLLERLPEDMDTDQLALVLIPVLATNEQEQEHFHELFVQCKGRVEAVHEQRTITPQVKEKRRLIWWVAGLTTVLLALIVPPLYNWITPEPPPSDLKSFAQITAGKSGLVCLDSASLAGISPIKNSTLCDTLQNTSIYGDWSLVDSLICLQYTAKDTFGLDSICVVVENEAGLLTNIYFLVEVTEPVTLTSLSNELFNPKPDPPRPDLSNLLFQPASSFARFHQQHSWWLKPLFIILLGLLLYVIIRWRELRRRKVVAALQSRDKPPYIWNIDLDDDQKDVDLGEYFHPLLRRLRLRTSDDFARLDIPLTVSATIEKAGMVDFRYLQQTRPPEYLMLIDRQNVRNHRARLFDLLYQGFRENEIYVERFFYKGDPRLVLNEAYPDGLTLKELQHRFPNARLLMIGNGYQLLSSVSGKLAGWTRIFDQWPLRSLLTTQPIAVWSNREHRLSERFQVLPASVQSLYYLVDQFDAGEESKRSDWQGMIKDVKTEPIRLDGGLVETLEKSYPLEMRRWIASCAIYPSLHWDLTLYFGRQLSTPEYPLLTVERILDLVRLPWFAEGKIPDVARALLLEELEQQEPQLLGRMREMLHTALQKSSPPSGSAAWEDYRMNVAINEWLFTKDKTRKKALEKEVEGMLENGAEADFAVLKYLDRERSPLDFIVPDRWKKYVHPGGHSGLGWKGLMKDLVYWALPVWVLLSALGIWYSPQTDECAGKKVIYNGQPVGGANLELCLENPAEELIYLEAEIRSQLQSLEVNGNPFTLMDTLDGLIEEALNLEVTDSLKRGFNTRMAAVIHNAGLPYYLRFSNQTDTPKDTACLFFNKAFELDSVDQDYLQRIQWCNSDTVVSDVLDPEASLLPNNQDSTNTSQGDSFQGIDSNYEIKVVTPNITSPRKEMTGRIGNINITMTYGSMSIRGRTIWGELVPYDRIWRTGANEATTFEVDRDVLVEGQPLPSGKYALFSIPGQNEWTFIFNAVWDQWGAYDYDESRDVLRVVVSPRNLSQFFENQDFIIENNEVIHRWERLAVPFRVSSAPDVRPQNTPPQTTQDDTQGNQACYASFLQRGKQFFEAEDYEMAINNFEAARICADVSPTQYSEINDWIDRARTGYIDLLKAALEASGEFPSSLQPDTRINPSGGDGDCYSRFLQSGIAYFEALDYEKAINNFKAAEICDDAPSQNPVSEWLDRTYKSYVNTLKAARNAAENPAPKTTINYGNVTGPDKKVYKTINLLGKTWLADNLNIEVQNSWCYDDNPANCQQYGRLYTWEAAKEACQRLGEGWRLPTDEEWKALAQSFGGYYDSGTAKGVGDPEKSYQALFKGGSSGFSALLGGYRSSGGNFSSLERSGYYWSATEFDADKAWNYYFGSGELFRDSYYKSLGPSCRCLKD